METQYVMLLSEIIDKMDIKDDLINIEINTGDKKNDNVEIAKQILSIIISKIYKAKDEIYKFISEYKQISIDEAKKTDIIKFIKEDLGQIKGISDFFQSL